MIHQDQAGLILGDILQALGLIGEAGTQQCKVAEHIDQRPPEDIGLLWRLVTGTGQCHHGIVVHFFDGGFHKHAHPFI